MTMSGMSYTNQPVENKNLYLYNGKELQTDHNLDWFDYGARFYDAQIARFHTVDRFAEKYSFQSPYVYAGNNPILYIDKNGDSLTVNAQYWADKLHKYADNKISKLNSTKADLNIKLISGKISRNKYEKKLEKANTSLYNYHTAKIELYELEESTQVYDVKMNDDLGSNSNGTSVLGQVTFNTDNDYFEISLLSSQGHSSTLGQAAHEFKHAYQFEVSELGFTSDGQYMHPNFLDNNIEREANTRALQFGPSTMTTPLGGEQKKYIKNIYEARTMASKNAIFRYDGATYYK